MTHFSGPRAAAAQRACAQPDPGTTRGPLGEGPGGQPWVQTPPKRFRTSKNLYPEPFFVRKLHTWTELWPIW